MIVPAIAITIDAVALLVLEDDQFDDIVSIGSVGINYFRCFEICIIIINFLHVV